MWCDLPMIFTCDIVTRENNRKIASLVTPKLLFTVTHALFFIYSSWIPYYSISQGMCQRCVLCCVLLQFENGRFYPYSSELLNSLAPGKFEWNFKCAIFKWILVADGWGISCDFSPNMNMTGLHLWSINIDSGNGLVPSGNNHYLSQCWPRYVLPYGVTRPQWVNWQWGNHMMKQPWKMWVNVPHQSAKKNNTTKTIGRPILCLFYEMYCIRLQGWF